MGGNEKSVQLKLFVDRQKRKVVFAEAEKDFVDILFSFFTLPMGTIARLSTKMGNMKLGSLSSLYKSVMNLDVEHFCTYACKDLLLNPSNVSSSIFHKLKVNLHDTNPIGASISGSHDDGVFVKNGTSFIITDDLKFSNLLNLSLLTNNPLTNLVFGGRELCLRSSLSCSTNSTSSNSAFMSKISSQPRTMKILVQKSKKKVLCAQVDDSFVELLFSFLIFRLGVVRHLTMDNSSPAGIHNLLNSVLSLGEGKYLKSEDVESILLGPKLVLSDLHVINSPLTSDVNIRSVGFLKEQATFIVSDDLQVTVSTSISMISKFNKDGIPVGDMEVVEVSVGEPEALLMLKDFLTSTSVLTDCLTVFTKKRKVES
ncbi:hypothetical protein L6452_36904 [Arctium lappa]|uniref:Uncharacterized protein n=1 Tax=Arctium lappa TaxID=4217 RepID=A0ACB8Y307_ARCLA|nr:hypothetical protein L6452_36904 [Arctium lappa]